MSRALARRYGRSELPPHETSFSALSDHDWNVLKNLWARGIDWCVHKVGRHWAIGESFGKRWPLFKTKKAAWDAVTKLVLAESRYRAQRGG